MSSGQELDRLVQKYDFVKQAPSNSILSASVFSCRQLSHLPPGGFVFELFLDSEAQSYQSLHNNKLISKSV